MDREYERSLAAADLVQRSGGEIGSAVRGHSMGETLPPGTRIRIGRETGAGYRVGMVVAFLAGDVLVAHRVVRISRDRRGRDVLLTRGDGSLLCDPPIGSRAIIGEVRAMQDADVWRPVGAAPRAGRFTSASRALILDVVTVFARVDRDLTSRAVEFLITLGRRVASAGRGATQPDA